MSERRSVSAQELADQISVGEIDTVLVAFPDLQGRLIGKRTNARFYLEHVANGEGTENCNYLIATDMDNNPVPGYRYTSYDLGYGDVRAVVDPATIRMVPWVDRTAMVMCDLFDVDTGEPVEVAPRRPGDPSAVWADNTLVREVLGWEARHDLDAILSSAWAWHSSHRDGYGTAR